uniref:Small ribosomal subunit protein mS31 n=1 Tax=Serinus canaria TaxID=9135 RepID=A0A8C9UFW9_SERCA
MYLFPHHFKFIAGFRFNFFICLCNILVGREFKDHLVLNPPPWAGTPFTRLSGSDSPILPLNTSRHGASTASQGNLLHKQELFSTSSVLSKDKDKSATTKDSTPEGAAKRQADGADTPKQQLLDIIGNMKVEVSYRKKLQQLKTSENKKQSLEPLLLNPELVKAASAVASSLPRNKKQTESELLAQLRRHEETTDKQKKGGPINLRNVISEMTFKRQSPEQWGARLSGRISLQLDEDGQRTRPERSSLLTNLNKIYFLVSSPTIWDLEFAKEVAAVTAQPPRNGFEEMIQWTKEGILWEFPIDNEVGMEDDAEFHEHIFLEKHLEGFPKEGPIRHFMELVICGLSKNPYLSVRQKVEHIEWFQKYFEEKKELLQEI